MKSELNTFLIYYLVAPLIVKFHEVVRLSLREVFFLGYLSTFVHDLL